MAVGLNLHPDRELWKYVYLRFPFSRSIHLNVLPDYNAMWAEHLWQEDPLLRPELLSARHKRIIKAIEKQARACGYSETAAALRL